MIVKGQRINDRYQIVKTIGEGGMANVYLAYDTILDRNVAVKVLRGDLASDEKFVRRFQREALAASSLSHPNIVEVYDVGEDNGSYYIVMEYIEGKHLKQLIKKRGSLTLTEVVDIMLQVTDGMSAAHDKFIIHRDIKPQNIMILENGLIKITDFGIAMALNSTQLTQTNSVMGSVHYLPPEQASGKGATIQSDVYSMGILMYELLTGTLPFRGDNAVEIALKHIKEPFPRIKEKNSNIPQSIENIIMKATAKNVKNRYADAKEMYDDLKTALTDARASEPKYTFKYTDDEIENKNNRKKTEDEKLEEFLKDEPKKEEKRTKKTDEKTSKKESKKEESLEKDDVEVKATKIVGKPIASKIENKKKENKLLLVLACIFTGLVVIVTTLVFLLPKMINVKEIKIPDVSGLSVNEAEEKLEDLGLTVANETKEVVSSDIKEGNVVKTSPSIGRTVKKNSTIVLYVSSGEDSIVLEDYKNENAQKIKGKLEEHGIYVIIKSIEDESKKFNADEIIKFEPAAGTKVKAGDTVTLYTPDMSATYPDFTKGDYSLKEIEEWCEKYSVSLIVNEIPNSEYKQGTIYEQSQPEGRLVMSGQTLKISVAQEEEDDDRAAEEIDAEDN